MLDYIQFIQKDLSEQELTDFTANLSSNLAELPAGRVFLLNKWDGAIREIVP